MSAIVVLGSANMDLVVRQPRLPHPGETMFGSSFATIPGGTVYAVVGDGLVTLQFNLPLSVDDPYALVVPLLALAVPRAG